MGHGVLLVGPQGDFRVHARKADMGTVILAGPDGVEYGIVLPAQSLPALRVFENPLLKRFTDCLLLLLGNRGLLLVEDADLLSVLPFFIKYPHIPLVQRGLEDFIGVDALGAVGGICADVIRAVLALTLHPPFTGRIGVIKTDFLLPQALRRLQQLKHKLLVILRGNPGRAHPDTDLRSGQVLGLYLFQLLRVDGELRILFGGGAGLGQLHPDIAGEVFIRRLPAPCPIFAALCQVEGAGGGVLENDALQILHDLRNLIGSTHQTCHILQVHAGLLANGHRQGLHRRVHAGDGLPVLDGALGEHIRLALQISFIVQHFQGTQKRVGGILFKGPPVAQAAQQAVFFRESVIKAVELGLLRLDFIVPGVS